MSKQKRPRKATPDPELENFCADDSDDDVFSSGDSSSASETPRRNRKSSAASAKKKSPVRRVAAVLDDRDNDGVLQFLIRWQGGPKKYPDSWEDGKRIPKSSYMLIEKYYSQKQEKIRAEKHKADPDPVYIPSSESSSSSSSSASSSSRYSEEDVTDFSSDSIQSPDSISSDNTDNSPPKKNQRRRRNSLEDGDSTWVPPTDVTIPSAKRQFKRPRTATGVRAKMLEEETKPVIPVKKAPPVKKPTPPPPTKWEKISAVKGIDKVIAEMILNHVVDDSPGVTWDTIVGQESAKQALQEAVVWPALHPELFTGITAPVRGLLLFGPPGNGKTLLAKAVASESKQTFFNVSASALTSKWIGESEKLVRTLFSCARALQPSIIFFDEIDSLLCSRREDEGDHARKLKTEFLVQCDGLVSKSDDRILIIAATNLPQELDCAALRRFPKRIMVGMPDANARSAMLKKLFGGRKCDMSEADYEYIAGKTEGYSGSDMAALAKEAAMRPIRDMCHNQTTAKPAKVSQLRAITKSDLRKAIRIIRTSVPEPILEMCREWAAQYAACP